MRAAGESRLWIAGWGLGIATAAGAVGWGAVPSALVDDQPERLAVGPLAAAVALGVVAGLAWSDRARRDYVTCAWGAGLVALLDAEAFLIQDLTLIAVAFALTAALVAVLAAPLHEERLWWAGTVVVSVTSVAVLVLLTPPTHFLTASASPGEGLWVAIGCLAAGFVLHLTGPAYRRWIDPILAVGALYVLSLGILELAERAFGGSIQTDFERGHVLVSSFWALIGLALLVVGLIRDERLLRYGGLALFGLSLAKIFLYDLGTLSSVARALSFIAVGALVLAGGFFLQKLSSHMGPRRPHTP